MSSGDLCENFGGNFMSAPFLAEIRAFGFGFPPRNWALCNGQLMAINANTALFSLLGTTYGGNGISNFALPNLQSMVPLGFGTSPAGNTYDPGQIGGHENVILTQDQMGAHNHALMGVNAAGTAHFPVGAYGSASSNPYYAHDTAQQPLVATTVAQVGGGAAHTNIQPYLTISWCIALQGIYPSRN
jgi:microcystin-dependent protein